MDNGTLCIVEVDDVRDVESIFQGGADIVVAEWYHESKPGRIDERVCHIIVSSNELADYINSFLEWHNHYCGSKHFILNNVPSRMVIQSLRSITPPPMTLSDLLQAATP